MTEQELKQYKEVLNTIEQEMVEIVAEFRADGRISKEERAIIKSIKLKLKEAKKNYKQAVLQYKQTERLAKKKQRSESVVAVDNNQSNSNSDTPLLGLDANNMTASSDAMDIAATINNDDWVEQLYNFVSLYKAVYIDKHSTALLPIAYIETNLNASNDVTQSDINLVYQWIDNKRSLNGISNEQGVSETYKSTLQDVIEYFKENKGLSCSEIRAQAEVYIERYRIYEHWTNEISLMDAVGYYNHFQTIIKPNIAALLITQEDIDYLTAWQSRITAFINFYEGLAAGVLKEHFAGRYQSEIVTAENLPTYQASLESARDKATKRSNVKSHLAAMTETEQIDADPDLANATTAAYKNRDTDPKKENKKNDNFLRKQKIYDKKNDSYSIYTQGDGDDADLDINDIVQGALGDCFLLSSIAAVAKANPSIIQNIISYNDQDEYVTVTLHIRQADGSRVATQIKVDFYFPIGQVSEKFAYAKGGDGELWVMIIEKAYAKEMGGYDVISKGGDALEALAVLTGREGNRQVIESDDVLLGRLLKDLIEGNDSAVAETKKKNEIKGYSTEVVSSEDPSLGDYIILPNRYKLVCGHAYSIIGVNTDKKIVKLYNPHGSNKRGDEEIPRGEIEITFKQLRDCFADYCVVDS